MKTCSIDSTSRSRLEMQGYRGYSDEQLAAFGSWTRLAPGLCVAIGIWGTITASWAVIWALALVALFGAATPKHPFDALYNRLLRSMLGTAGLPEHRHPRRFACAVATAWLLGTGLAFWLDGFVTGSVLGVLFVIIAGIPVVTGFCVPSFVYGLLVRRAGG